MVGLAVIVAVHSSLCTPRCALLAGLGSNVTSATPNFVAAGCESNRVEADAITAGEVG